MSLWTGEFKSGMFQMSREDWEKWLTNTILFFAPAMIIFLTVIQQGGTFQEAFIAVRVWMIGVSVDLLRKFLANNTK